MRWVCGFSIQVQLEGVESGCPPTRFEEEEDD